MQLETVLLVFLAALATALGCDATGSDSIRSNHDAGGDSS